MKTFASRGHSSPSADTWQPPRRRGARAGDTVVTRRRVIPTRSSYLQRLLWLFGIASDL